MAKEIPDKLPAGHFASIFGTVISGLHADSNRRYAMVEPQMGGWGATSLRAGQSAMFSTSHGDTYNCPVEIAEARYGFEVKEKTLANTPSPTNDEHPGGSGVCIQYSLRAEAVLSAGYSHANAPVWSMDNCQPGGVNSLRVTRHDGSVEKYTMVSGLKLEGGDTVTIVTAGGGTARKKR